MKEEKDIPSMDFAEYLRKKVELDYQRFLLEPLLRPYFIKGAGFVSLSRFLVTFLYSLHYQCNIIISLFNM